MNYAYIIAGAIAGAPLRYFVAGHVQRYSGGPFPMGTLVVNISGCFLIGLIAALAEERAWLSREGRMLLVTGFLGSYTTFSAFGLETHDLAREGEVARAFANVLFSCALGLAAVFAGVRVSHALN